jgi:osmotically-inducible protein OsmY
MMRRWFAWLLLVLVLQGLAGCATLDRRSFSTSLEDEHIQSQAISQISRLHTDTVHVNVTVFNRHVLLTGEVPNEASKSQIAQIVSGVPNINGISNELVVGDVEGIASRTEDSLISSSVKFRFMSHSSFGSGRVKIVTEDGVVYLMGLLYHKEADSAAYIASTTKGVKKVVTMFDYLD